MHTLRIIANNLYNGFFLTSFWHCFAIIIYTRFSIKAWEFKNHTLAWTHIPRSGALLLRYVSVSNDTRPFCFYSHTRNGLFKGWLGGLAPQMLRTLGYYNLLIWNKYFSQRPPMPTYNATVDTGSRYRVANNRTI